MSCRARTVLLAVAIFYWFGASSGRSATLAGQSVKPGGTLDLRFPLDKYFQDYAAAGGNTRPTTGRALISFPKRFDPARACPILIVISTSDYHRTNAMDAPFYQEAGMAEGWIVLAAHATAAPACQRIQSLTLSRWNAVFLPFSASKVPD